MRSSSRLAVWLMIAGCGGGGDSSVSRPSIGTTKDNVCDQIAKVACYDMYLCCSEGEIERKLGVSDPRTGDQCIEDMTRICERRLATQEASLAANRVRFDSAAMDACLKALLAPEHTCATVEMMLPWTMACMSSPWVGTVAAGSQCFYTFECADAGSSYCAPNQTCTALPTDGMPCSPQFGCAKGFYCNAGTCRTQLGAGAMCSSNAQCMMGLFCDLTMTMPTCQTLKGPGQPCSGPQSCMSGQCLPGSCMGTGQTCYTDTNCGGHCANNSQFCTTDSQCGAGHCSITTTRTCFQPTDCLTGDGTCVFPVMCIPGMCVGDVVCSSTQVTVDYCTGAVGALPLP